MRCWPMSLAWLRERVERLCGIERRRFVRFRLKETYGNPPQPGGGIWMSGSLEEAEREVRARYGDRLEHIDQWPL
jgi:hypothetical protein